LARASQWTGLIAPASSAAPAQAFALAGDAAHAIHPLAGQGLNVGLGDAMALAQIIQAKEFWRPLSDLKMLRRYERARQAEVLAMGCVTDGLQVLFAQPALPIQKIRNWGMSGFNQLLPLKNWMARKAMQTNN
jgi:2-polyprenyl-6-methoxyphenol hydroxylase-like FAD-dependent oxidoreductase